MSVKGYTHSIKHVQKCLKHCNKVVCERLVTLCIEKSDTSVEGRGTHFAMHVDRCLRTLVIKAFLRTLLACQVENSASSVNGSGNISTMHVKKCLKIRVIKIIQKDTCTPMFIAALFTIARIQKQPKCPTTDEWIKKMWYLYTMEY